MKSTNAKLLTTALLLGAVACGPKTETATMDLAAVVDLRKAHDLAGADLVSSPLDQSLIDQAVVIDLQPPDDLTPPPDLVPPADLTVLPPDLLGCTPPNRHGTLAVAGVTSTGGLHVARFAESGGWTDAQTFASAALTDVAATRLGSRVAIVGRMNDTVVSAAVDDPCTYASVAPTGIGFSATSSVRPAVIGGDDALDLIFRGSTSDDRRYYWSRSVGLGFDAPVTQGNLLTLMPASLTRVGASLHVLFTGDDSNVYDGVTSAVGGAATAVSSAASTNPPSAVTLADGSILVVYTANDTNVSFSRSNVMVFATPKLVCDGQASCLDATNVAPTLALDAAGKALVVWAGKDAGDGTKNKGLYAASYDATGGTWSAAAQITDEVVNLPVAAAAGVGTASFEVVYVRSTDGALRHARLISTWQAATSVDGTAGAINAAPALVSIP